MPDLTPYLIAVGGITGMLMVWLLVQRTWSQVFAVGDADVLEVRAACDGCALAEQCAPQTAPSATTTCAVHTGH